MNRIHKAPTATPALALFVALLAGSLTACGGGSSAADTTASTASVTDTDNAAPAAAATTDTASTSDTSASTATAAASTPATSSAVDAEIAATAATPTFDMAPALPPEPSTADAGGTNASAHQAPRTFTVDAAAADLSTHGLTPQTLAAHLADGGRSHAASVTTSASTTTTPATTRTLTGAVYTPAQIRAAYGLADLPATGATLSAATAAALGRGQTIYIIDAYHDASALTDLNTFSTRFGLPTCTNAAIASTATLPLAAASSSCTLSVVYATSASTMSTTAPSYSAAWAPESKLDVQWAHAIAPLARIVLIETPDAMTNNLLGGIGLANRMGAGVVSMSFGVNDPGWATTEDSKFTTTGMTYLAATGDTGGIVQWPAVSPNVLAVGGTGMNWSGSGTRYEQAWSSGGGGISLYEPAPAWQSGLVPHGGTTVTKRAQADVSFNANPMTGQYVALTSPTSTTTTWTAYGGTSISTPQWAGIIAVANAIRATSSKATLGDIHSLIYKTIAPVPGTYASAFSDIVDGSNGTCATCTAGTGFDTATGWGTPNVAALLPILTGTSTATVAAAPAAAPTVPGGSITGRVGVALSQTLGVTNPSGVTSTYALTSAPSGMTVDTAGVLHWAAPVAGSYSFTAKATTSAGGTATGTYTLKVIPNTAPAFTSSASLTATSGVSYTTTLTATNPNAGTLVYSSIGTTRIIVSSSGTLTWTAPVAGTYRFTTVVTDSYGLTSSRLTTLTVH